jgi:hypothetical protein
MSPAFTTYARARHARERFASALAERRNRIHAYITRSMLSAPTTFADVVEDVEQRIVDPDLRRTQADLQSEYDRLENEIVKLHIDDALSAARLGISP